MYRTEIILNQFEFGAKPNGAGGSAQSGNISNNSAAVVTPPEPKYPDEDINPEEIPF